MAKKKAKPKSKVAAIRDEIRKRFERPSLIFETDRAIHIPTRFPLLNARLGGGVKVGAIMELYGFEDSGKSSTAIAIASDVQKAAKPGKKTVVLVNYEGPEDYDWWRALGLDTNESNDPPSFIQLRPKSLEEGVADAAALMETDEVCAVIFDSVYAASSKEGQKLMVNWGDPSKTGDGTAKGLEARKWGIAWTNLKTTIQDFGVVCIAVNQMREDIDISTAGKPKWAPKPTTTPRGKALKFYAWIRMEMQGRYLKDREEDGKLVRMKIIKNKTSADDRGFVEYPLIRGEGFDLLSDLIDLALQAGFIEAKGGGNFYIGSRRIRGRDELQATVKKNAGFRAKLQEKVSAWLEKKEEDDEEEPEED